MRREFRITLPILALACMYLGWIYYSRWSENRAYIQRLEERKAEQLRKVVEAYGEDRLTILGFYAVPATIRRGKKAQLCYSVSNSKSVRIEPPVKNVWPSLSRCVDVTPTRTTVYRIIAEDAGGHTKMATTTITVQ